MTSLAQPYRSRHLPGRRAAAAIAGSVVAPVLVWAVAAATGTDLRVTPPGQSTITVNVGFVVVTTLLAALVGWGALAILRRLSHRARSVWTILALAALLLSLIPLATSQATASTRVFLALMHIAVAAVLVPGLRAASAARDGET